MNHRVQIAIPGSFIGHASCILLLFCTILSYSHAKGQNIYDLRFEQITSIQGLSNNTVYDIKQDAEGYIWIATREGLNKFDGHTITTYDQTSNSGIPGNFIEKILVSRTGRLIIGTQEGVCIYEKEVNEFSSLLLNDNSVGDIFDIIELSTNEILLSSTEGIFRLEQEQELRKISDYPVRALCEFKTGIFWGLYNDDILIMNVEGEVIRRYSGELNNTSELDMSASNIECMYRDSRDIIWLGTKRDGLSYYDPITENFVCVRLKQGVNPIEDNFIRVINEDRLGRLWIGTESGLYVYDPETESFSFYGQNFNPTENGLNDKAIYSIFRSKDDLMWIGTYFGGVNFTSLYGTGFHRIYADGGKTKLSGNAVSEIIEARDGRLWIGTEDGGINIYDPGKETFSYVKHIPDDPNSLSSNNVHTFAEDQEGNIWIGTFIGGLNKYNIKTRKIETVKLVPPAERMAEDVYSKSLFSVYIDSKNRIWAGSIEGLYLRENATGEFRIWEPKYFQNNFIYHIEEDISGNIWICSYNEGIYKIDPEMKITNYRTGGKYDITSNRIIFCLVDSSQFVWFGSMDGGLIRYDPQKDEFKSYTVKDGLPNNTVYAIVKDLKGDIWCSTNRGISMFDVDAGTFVNYTENDGLIGNQFNFKSGLITSRGTIYFGAVNGLTYFDPENIRKDEYQPDLRFIDIRIFNKPVAVGEENILNTQIEFQDEISLKYKHKVLTIDFVALNYTAPKKTNYAYYLEGLEEDWNYVGNQRSATYTNLLPGSYVFHLKASNNNHHWSDSGRSLKINVSPPFWFSPMGFILYALILISLVFLGIRLYVLRQKERMNIKLERMEKEKNEEIIRHRMNFFTYISHEFKTPLTLIIATLEHIMNYEDILPRFKDYGIVMRKNAMRLLFLINQLMEFRKVETDHSALNFYKGDVIEFIRSTFQTFHPLMKKKSIKGKFKSDPDSYIVYFDADKLEKILTNLLSNSCKSFKDPGTISVDVRISTHVHLADPSSSGEMTGDLIISILDDGPGLPPEKLKNVFEPFTASDPSDFHSSGLGLSLVNSLVKYLNGEIKIANQPKGGTSVLIQLPLIHNPAPELIRNGSFIGSNSSLGPDNIYGLFDDESEVVFDFQDDGSYKEYQLLVVEDNRELASFLCHHFKSVFKVSFAADGSEAIAKIKKSPPDLVISDIMMPQMDGFALCSAIKDSIETSHIPVILLTSKNGEDSRLEGFYKGADAYVGKPFKLKELDLQVRNILRARENLRKHFASLENFQQYVNKLGNKDQMFIKTLTGVVHKHLDNGNFDVDMFCREASVSRTLMHNKIKSITGLSTTEFIKNIRLNEAKKLLMDGKFTVSEISYRVGFNDPAYFSKSFKKAFGKNPTEIHEPSAK